MKERLWLNAAVKFTGGLLLMAVLLFLPAGSLRYPNAWLFLALLFIPMLLLGVILLVKAPELLRKRLSAKEQSKGQKRVVGISGLMFLAGFAVSSLDYRFGWSAVPQTVVIAASVLLVASYGLYAEVMRENAWLSRMVEVQEGQMVVDTGLYGIVRHPMYTATIFLFLSVPLVLGSLFGFAVFLIYPVLIVKRIMEEEILLTEKLEGYREYRNKVKYRLIPYLW